MQWQTRRERRKKISWSRSVLGLGIVTSLGWHAVTQNAITTRVAPNSFHSLLSNEGDHDERGRGSAPPSQDRV